MKIVNMIWNIIWVTFPTHNTKSGLSNIFRCYPENVEWMAEDFLENNGVLYHQLVIWDYFGEHYILTILESSKLTVLKTVNKIASKIVEKHRN